MKTVHTVEYTDGSFKIIDDVNEHSQPIDKSNHDSSKNTLKLIKKFYDEGLIPNKNKVGFESIPQFFKFSFFEDANDDHSEALQKFRGFKQ